MDFCASMKMEVFQNGQVSLSLLVLSLYSIQILSDNQIAILQPALMVWLRRGYAGACMCTVCTMQALLWRMVTFLKCAKLQSFIQHGNQYIVSKIRSACNHYLTSLSRTINHVDPPVQHGVQFPCPSVPAPRLCISWFPTRVMGQTDMKNFQ